MSEEYNNILNRGDSYIEMQLNDIMLLGEEHFHAVKDVIDKYNEISHIVTIIGFNSLNIDKAKLIKKQKLKDTEDVKLDTYVFATVAAKINRELDNSDLITSNILIQIHKFVNQYLRLH